MTLNDMRKVIESDAETKALKISDAEVLRVYQYLLMRDQNSDDQGYKPVLITSPYIEIVYVPTEAKKQQIEAMKMKEHLKFFDSEVFVQDASLDEFDAFNEERQKVLKQARYFLDHYQKDHYQKGLYLYGKYATGKTFILSAIAKELAKRNISVLLVFLPDLTRNMKQGMSEGNLEERINQLKQVDVLMLDDLGGENITEWFRDEIFMPIIQYRLSAQLPVFISSNLTVRELTEVFSHGRNEIDMIKAMRLIQRINDLTIYVKLSESKYKD